MDKQVWQDLLALESRDIVTQWFEKLHHRQLNERRSIEITMAARQAREYFRNASNADYSVRPLLTFYGVASLSRSATLLFTKNTGEATLKPGHGLDTVGWSSELLGEIRGGLKNVGRLKIRKSAGLFDDFIQSTRNRLPVHINGEKVDWRIDFDTPKVGSEICLLDILRRLPDLSREHKVTNEEVLYAYVNEMKSEDGSTVQIAATSDQAERLSDLFHRAGYSVSIDKRNMSFVIPEAVLSRIPVQLFHTYLNKAFGKIPNLHIVVPVESGERYSQLAFTYMLGFILGMLVRYYPTQWGSLIGGGKGDLLWPTINRAQQIVEETFPELIYEVIHDAMAYPFESK